MEKTPATIQELKSTFPNSSADWRESQLEAENDIGQAAIEYAKHVETKAAEEREEHAKQLEAAKNAKPASDESLGHSPLSTGTLSDSDVLESGDPIADFDAAVRQRLPRNREASYQERQNAIAFVARTQPNLHRSYIEANNASTRQKRLISEKYESVPAGN